MSCHYEDKESRRVPKQFACEYPGCGRLFKTKFSMKRHAFVHNEDKRYTCRFCNKRFSLPQYVKEHTYIHTKDKPYVCGVGNCKEKFRQAGKLSLHRRTHPEYKLKQYDCHAEFKGTSEQIPIVKEEPRGDNQGTQWDPTEELKYMDPAPKEVSPVLLRRESGRSTTEEMEEMNAENRKMQKFIRACNEAIREKDDAEMLKQYLNFINSPITLIMRPVLPLPRDRREQKLDGFSSHTDLCEMLLKYAKE